MTVHEPSPFIIGTPLFFFFLLLFFLFSSFFSSFSSSSLSSPPSPCNQGHIVRSPPHDSNIVKSSWLPLFARACRQHSDQAQRKQCHTKKTNYQNACYMGPLVVATTCRRTTTIQTKFTTLPILIAQTSSNPLGCGKTSTTTSIHVISFSSSPMSFITHHYCYAHRRRMVTKHNIIAVTK